MYTMKEVCEKVHLPYETLRFYCNEGLVPNVKRAKNNYRCFDDRDVAWLNSLMCLKRCGMSLRDMKTYIKIRYGILGQTMNIPGKSGRKISSLAYTVARRIIGFN